MVHLILVVKLSLPGEVKAGVTLRTYINALSRAIHAFNIILTFFKRHKHALQDDRNDIKMGHMGKKDR